MPSSRSSTRNQSRHDRPRVAVTGFYATYATGKLQGYPVFRPLFPATYEQLKLDYENLKNFSLPIETLTVSCGVDSVTRMLKGLLKLTGLWDGELSTGALAIDPQRGGVVFSASKYQIIFDENRVLDLFAASPGVFANEIAQKVAARGPRLSPVAACATGAHAMILGAQLIEDGYADVAICGAIEPILTPLILAAYDNMGALSKSGVMRPFDTVRDGFVPNVGAGCLILENEEKARERGAPIFGYLSGWAMNADATHMTAMCPSGDSIARAIEYSMQRADVTKVDYINAHGTATKLNDETEARGIKSALGNKVPVSSTKPLTGHLLGAAGAVEAVISLLALRENFAPPTLNLENIDSDCDLDLVTGKGRDVEMQSVLSLNYGFGGHLGALLFTKT